MRVSGKKSNVIRDVLAFLLRHWRREAWLVTGVAFSMIVATIADLFMPVFAGRMVDAIAMHNGTHRQALRAALSALATMLLLGGVLVAGRHLSLMGISRLTIRLMARVASDAFNRVQRFSTDWHANNFAIFLFGRNQHGRDAIGILTEVFAGAGGGRSFADGVDVGGSQAPTHHTLAPAIAMSPQAFEDLFNGLPWRFGGKT